MRDSVGLDRHARAALGSPLQFAARRKHRPALAGSRFLTSCLDLRRNPLRTDSRTPIREGLRAGELAEGFARSNAKKSRWPRAAGYVSVRAHPCLDDRCWIVVAQHTQPLASQSWIR